MNESKTFFPPLRSPRAQLAVLMLGHLLVDMYAGFLMPLVAPLKDHLGTRLSIASVVVGVSILAVNGIQPLAGWISPRLRRPMFLLLGPLLAGAITMIGLSHNVWMVMLLAVVGHLGVGVYHPDALMAAQVLSGSRAHVGVPIFLSGGFFGFSLGALMGTQWVSRFGFSGLWVVSLLSLPMLVLLVLTGLHRPEAKALRERAAVAASGDGPHLVLLAALSFLMGSSMFVLIMFLSVRLKERFEGPGIRWGGYAVALVGFSSAVASYGWGYLSKRISPFALIVTGQILGLPAYLLLIRSEIGWPILLLAVWAGSCMGGAFIPTIATLARRSPQLPPALRAGVIIGVPSGMAALLAAGCGLLTDFGVTSEQILLSTAALILATAAVAFLAYLRGRKPVRSDVRA